MKFWCMKLFQINGCNDESYWYRNSQLHTSLCFNDFCKRLEKQLVVGLDKASQFHANFISHHHYNISWWIMSRLNINSIILQCSATMSRKQLRHGIKSLTILIVEELSRNHSNFKILSRYENLISEYILSEKKQS